jgi:phosphohistidine phosphatase SixA
LHKQVDEETNMRFWVYMVMGLFGLGTLAMGAADPDRAAMFESMKTGGHILMIRHALAPGYGDPANFQIGDCSTQRNLDGRGREQASAIGKMLRSNGIASARVYSSQWCRCFETAELLALGPVAELPALNSFFELTQNREPHLKALRKFIAEQPPDGELVILVTHFVTVSAITGQGVSSGEGVLLKLNKNAPYEIVGRVNFDR